MLDPNLLNSKCGVRSLSKQSDYFGTDDDYWRGNVWMPINYMILRAFALYYTKDVNTYSIIKDSIIDCVFRNWYNTGHLYETYESISGEGKRGKYFTGWTSLVLLMINDIY